MRKSAAFFLMLAAAVATVASCSEGSVKQSGSGHENQVVEAIMSRRSIRRYRPQPVGKDTLNRILECGINAPNGMARESWEVRVITDPGLLSEMDSVYSEYMNRAKDTEAKKYEIAYGAPALVLIAYDIRYDLSQVDCGLLGGNMILAAESMGIGSCCLGGMIRFMNSEDGAALRNRMMIPETHRLLYAICFGYPDETPEAKPRDLSKIKFID